MKRTTGEILISQATDLFTYFLAPTMILALVAGINFQYIGGVAFLAGLAIIGLSFIVIFPRQKNDKDSKELLNTQEKLIIAQEEIKKLTKKIEDLERIDQSKNDFLKILAHDLKSPVNSILGLNEVAQLSEHADKEEMKKLIGKMVHAGRNLKMLIDNLLSWCINNQGRITPNIEKVSVLDVAEKSRMIYQFLAEDKRIELKIDISDDIYVKADKDHVFSILRNIVNNALKFTGKGGKVTVSAHRKEGYCILTIQDNGVGMDREKINSLLGSKNNHKVMRSLIGTKGELGNGLGLTICADLVTLNHGKIEINSVLDKGTVFSVSLPVFN
ncbi:HAMP domain-containing sensor histidine kinase [Fulvivirgaceae bacterium BMA12]|uniref:histidine kinase n=1 Tax=Agaribacillus aureus TaxID=3051825 RepID=A0ABT8KYR3_9BACT|nr:HAMP domain-containing sensor histidine kinase [Fulvivirgaceae bacterium BMA12]